MNEPLSPRQHIISWSAQIAAAFIMGQTLFFKFTKAEESVQLFTELRMEPHGRLLIGVLELVACIWLLTPKKALLGALLGSGLMAGAIAAHAWKLGWQGDRLTLALLAIVALASCSTVVVLRRKEFPSLPGLLGK